MKFVSIRIITDDMKRLVGFYEQVTRLPPAWFGEDFAEIATPSGTLAIAARARCSFSRPATRGPPPIAARSSSSSLTMSTWNTSG